MCTVIPVVRSIDDDDATECPFMQVDPRAIAEAASFALFDSTVSFLLNRILEQLEASSLTFVGGTINKAPAQAMLQSAYRSVALRVIRDIYVFGFSVVALDTHDYGVLKNVAMPSIVDLLKVAVYTRSFPRGGKQYVIIDVTKNGNTDKGMANVLVIEGAADRGPYDSLLRSHVYSTLLCSQRLLVYRSANIVGLQAQSRPIMPIELAVQTEQQLALASGQRPAMSPADVASLPGHVTMQQVSVTDGRTDELFARARDADAMFGAGANTNTPMLHNRDPREQQRLAAEIHNNITQKVHAFTVPPGFKVANGPVGQESQNIQFYEKMYVEEVCRFMGLPSAIIGTNESTATSESIAASYMTACNRKHARMAAEICSFIYNASHALLGTSDESKSFKRGRSQADESDGERDTSASPSRSSKRKKYVSLHKSAQLNPEARVHVYLKTSTDVIQDLFQEGLVSSSLFASTMASNTMAQESDFKVLPESKEAHRRRIIEEELELKKQQLELAKRQAVQQAVAAKSGSSTTKHPAGKARTATKTVQVDKIETGERTAKSVAKSHAAKYVFYL